MWRAVAEELEARTLLTAVVSSGIPNQITPSSAPQASFAPGASAFALNTSAGFHVLGTQLYRFSVVDAQPSVVTTFSTTSPTPKLIDTALALFDSDGNLVQTADADAGGLTANETLSAALQSGRPYILGVYSANLGLQPLPAEPFTLMVNTGPQRMNSGITLNPASGTAEFQATTPPDTFASPSDANYFPIDLTNIGQSASITVNQLGPDDQFFAALFRRDGDAGTWQEIASGSGAPVALTAVPATGADDTDSQYVLAVSPLNLNSAVEPYKVDVASSTLLGPATVSPAGISTLPLAPGALGTATAAQTQTSFSAPFLDNAVAIATGPITFSLTPSASNPLLSVYDATGSMLLGVVSRTSQGAATLTLNATAGETFIVRSAIDGGTYSGSATVSLTQTYAPRVLNVSNSVQQQSGLVVDPSQGGRFFRMTPAGDYLVLQLTPDSGSTLTGKIIVVGSTFGPVQASAASGQPVFLPVDLAKVSGPLDVYVAGTSGTGTATLSYATVSVPRQIPLGQLPTQTINVQTGGFSVAAQLLPFSQLVGAQFYEISPGQSQTLTATGAGGAHPLLVRYVEQNNVLQLDDRAMPNGGTATLTANLPGQRLYAVAALSLDPNSSGTVQLSVSGAAPAGVGVAMVPDPPPPLPPAQAQPPFVSKFRVRGEVIQQPEERDLFATILPFDLNGLPTLSFSPATADGPLAVKITVLDASNNTLDTFITSPGQVLPAQTLSNVTGSFAGQTLRVLIEPLANQPVGDGTYSVEIDAPTTDPNPYIANETTLSASSVTPVNVPFGSATAGDFAGSSPTLQFYSFTLPNLSTPFQVWTTDNDPTVNTDIKLYRAHYTRSIFTGLPIIDSYVELPTEPPPSLDYFPADRSTIDARIVVNNYTILPAAFTDDPNQTDYSPGSGRLFVSVKNEQGTQGHYQIHVGAVPTNLVGPGTFDPFGPPDLSFNIDPESGTANNGSSVGPSYLLGLTTPHGMTGSPLVTINGPSGSDTANIDVYDSSRNYLYTASGPTNGTVSIQLSGVAASSQYYLHVYLNSGNVTTVSMSAPVSTSSAPNQPPDSDNLTRPGAPWTPSEPYTRATPAPDGSYSLDDFYDPGQSGTLDKLVFYVGSSGMSQFALNMQNVNNASYALYRGGGGTSGEFNHFSGQLIDFNSAGTDLSFSDFLTPGFYYVRLIGSVPSSAPYGRATLAFNVPAYDAQKIVLDPNTAQNDTAPLRTVDIGSVYATDFYEVAAPGDVQSDLSVDLNGIFLPPTTIDGQGLITIFKKTGSTYTQMGNTGEIDYYSYFGTGGQPITTVTITSNDSPLPGDRYYVGLNRDRLSQSALIGPSFLIPQSGTPDLVVEPIQLLADNGQTQVAVTVRNQGYAAAPVSHGQLTFSNYPTSAILNQAAIGPFGTITYVTDWHPDSPSNTVAFTANYDNQFTELNVNNNSQTVALSSVDPAAPTISISLKDPTLNAEPGATWGRYVSGVLGLKDDILISSADADSSINASTGPDLYQTIVTGPVQGGFTATGGNYVSSHSDDIPVDFGGFAPTSAAYPNEIDYEAIDAYGLTSGRQVQKLDVVADPQFYSSVTWDPIVKQYELAFQRNLIDQNQTVSQILGFNVPVVGDKNNEFLIGISANGTAGLDPTVPVSLPISGHVLLMALANTFYDQTFDGSSQPTDHLSIHTEMAVDSHTLNASAAAISIQLQNQPLLNLETPEIKLFSFGIPGVASLDAGLKFGLNASLSAGAKIGLNPNALNDPTTAPDALGVMSPTFVEPSLGASATIEGDVDVLGFDAASLSGTVSLTLNVLVGLDNSDPTKVVPFDQFFNDLAVKVTAVLGIHLEADVAIIGDVWNYDWSTPIPLLDTIKQGIYTSDPPGASSLQMIVPALLNPSAAAKAALAAAASDTAPVTKTGSSLVGPYALDPHPQIVIDPTSGEAFSIQVQNVGTSAAPQGNLAFSQRVNGTWSALATLSTPEDVSGPVLALAHDAPPLATAPPPPTAVVVYQATDIAGSSAGLTLNQKLDDTELRYRYCNGSSWGPELSLTSNSLLDQSPAVAFNSSGQGVVAWVHNTNSAPIDTSGNYSRSTQDIDAAIWNSTTHTWSAPMPLTTPDGVCDDQPAAYVDPTGRIFVVWVRDTAMGNELMFSEYNGTAWSTASPVAISGLLGGGSFGEVAVGGDKMGRMDVIFSYRALNGDGSVNSTLYSLPLDPSNPTGNTYAEQIAHNANFSHLSVTNSPDGSLVAYWQQGDGVTNGVYGSALSRAVSVTSASNSSAPWSAAVRLTSTTDLTLAPSLAIDTNGHVQLLYHDQIADGGAPNSGLSDPSVGVPQVTGVGSSSLVNLPELTFINGLHFPYQGSAVAGGVVTGQATILNRGLATAAVTINGYVGLPSGGTLINTRQITLSPGATYTYSQGFPVTPGQQTYSVEVSSSDGEAISTSDDISTATLAGLPDLTIVSLAPSVQNPGIAQAITLAADVKNMGSVAVGAFDVTLQAGNPLYPQFPVGTPQTLRVASLGGGQDVVLNFPVTLPSTAGDYVYTAMADSGDAISEVTRSNNDAEYRLSFHADPAIGGIPGFKVSQVTTNLLNSTGANNVQVLVPVVNLGTAPISNLPVDLESSRNGGAYAADASQTIPLLNPGQGATLTFTVNGLAGDNIYRAYIDPSVNALDSNLLDNSGQAELVIRGLPDLTVSGLSLSTPTPRQGDPLSLNATIGNIGIDDASHVLVEVFAIPDKGGLLPVASMRIAQIAALSQVNVVIPIDTSGLLGPYRFEVIVNRLQEVLESNNLNNSAIISSVVLPNIPISNVIDGAAGIVNTIVIGRDPDGVDDDVWVNVATTATPTQLATVVLPITINGGGKNDSVVLQYTGGNPLPPLLQVNGTFTFTGLQSLSGTTLDLARSTVYLSDAGGADLLPAIQRALAIGYNGGAWNGQPTGSSGSIVTSAGSAKFGIGYADAADGTGTDPVPNTVELTYTVDGDANLDGRTNLADFLILTRHFGAKGGWDTGDFNYDQSINLADLLILVRHFGNTVATLSNVINATAGIANTITLARDPDGVHDDVWLNVPTSGPPTQLANLAQPITIDGSGKNDSLVLQYTGGNPLPALLQLNGIFTITGLQSLNGTTLDIARSTVFVNDAGTTDPLPAVQQALKTGYNGGAWNGLPAASTGSIITSAGGAGFGIGYADFADGSGINRTPQTIELKYTLYGDTNLDGTVSEADFLILAHHFGQAGGWDAGDFNYDFTINLPDLLRLTRHFGKVVPPTPTALLASARGATIPLLMSRRQTT